MASSRSTTVMVAAVMATTLLLLLKPSEAARKRVVASPSLRLFPGTRQRNPGGIVRPSPSVPGFPGLTMPPSVPSPPASSSLPPCAARPAQPLPSFPAQPGSGGGSSSSPAPATECVTVLAGLMTCASFLTGGTAETPAPEGDCCGGLGAFLNSSSAAEGQLRCLCPVILGDVNRVLPKPVDPVRMLYLPIACGLVLPPQVLFVCLTGQSSPPVITRFPDSWPTSALSP